MAQKEDYMKVISFLSDKGGVGKTSSVTTIGHMMAAIHNKKVLLIDNDPQGNTSAVFTTTDFYKLFTNIMTGETGKKQLDVEDMYRDSSVDIRDCIRHTAYDNLDIIPATLTLSESEELLKADVRTPQQFRLKMHLEKIKNDYDYCLIDCSPNLNILNINALAASHEVYIPTRSDGGSLLGIAITVNLVQTVQAYNPQLKIGGIFFTQFQKHKNVCKTAYELVNRTPILSEYLLPITIGISKLLEENSYQQKPLLELDRGSRQSSVTEGYERLTGYMMAPNKKAYLENRE